MSYCKKVFVFMMLAVFITSAGYAKKISDVSGFDRDGFDPWNQNRWADWYENGKLIKQFEIDCDVKFASHSGVWSPDVSKCENESVFLLSDYSGGINIDGNGIVIDVQPSRPPLAKLYDSYSTYEKNYATYACFKTYQNKSSRNPTIIKNFTIKGFIIAICVYELQTHSMIVQDCKFFRNRWGFFLSGINTTIKDCEIKENARGGIYIDRTHNNIIINNEFRDDNYALANFWADIAVDSAYNNRIEGNRHQPSDVNASYYHCAVKLYRNMGETKDIREESSYFNIVRNNTIEGYSVAYDVGSRMGFKWHHDLSGEGREYASYNLFENNKIINTEVGFKVNCSSNTIQSNSFTNVNKPIILHCVFYSLVDNVINNQAGDDVFFWFKESDYSGNKDYASWFRMQNDLNSGISECSKLIQVQSDKGQPNFQSYKGRAKIVIAPTLIKSDKPNMYDLYSTGGKPIDIAVGNFWDAAYGDEFAVIWDKPVSNINGTDYYSIIIYDCNGVELNRCGKSKVRWEAIAASDFLDISDEKDVVEIAVVPSIAIDGRYPLYVFGRGRKDPNAVLLKNNKKKIADIAAGNFKTDGDVLDEIAVIYANGSSTITFCKPSDANWSATTSNVSNLTKITAGNFDGEAANGDELAGINASSSLIYFYKVSGVSNFSTAAIENKGSWTAIAGGDFDGNNNRDEVVAAPFNASSGVYGLSYYVSGEAKAFRTDNHEVLTCPVRSLDAGNVVMSKIGHYERVKGFKSNDYAATMSSWGQQTAILPSQPETVSLPVIWLSANPIKTNHQYLRITPTLR